MISAGDGVTLRALDDIIFFAASPLREEFQMDDDDNVVTATMVDGNGDGYLDADLFTAHPDVLSYVRTEIALFRAGLIDQLRSDVCDVAICSALPDPYDVMSLSELFIHDGSIGAGNYLRSFDASVLFRSWGQAIDWNHDSEQALVALKSAGNASALSVLISVSPHNPRVVFGLSKLAGQGDPQAARALKKINPDTLIATLRDRGRHPDERSALESLRQAGNRRVIKVFAEGEIQAYERRTDPCPEICLNPSLMTPYCCEPSDDFVWWSNVM